MRTTAATTTRALMTNVTNPPTMVPGADDPPAAPPSHPRLRWLRRYWWVAILATMGLVTTSVVVASLLIHVNYVIVAPGQTEPVNELISVPADQNHPTKDRIDLVTVTVDDAVTLFD